MWLGNRAESVVMFLACARNGIACNPSLHRTYTPADVVLLLERLDAKALLTEPGWGADAKEGAIAEALRQVPSLLRIYEPGDFPAPGPAAVAARRGSRQGRLSGVHLRHDRHSENA